MGENRDPEFALIIGAARSGTTLLRLLLDAHPEIGCPAEAGVPALMSHMATVWTTIDADVRDDGLATDPGQTVTDRQGVDGDASKPDVGTRSGAAGRSERRLPEPAIEWIQSSAITAMRRYCDREDKRLYVDKSLDSVYHLDLVRELFPDVRCVLAFRHVMDTIASGIEASPWGFQAYGYAPYVQDTPGNAVVALARYWLDHVSQALEWEKQHPDICMRVRYEDLVASPEETICSVQRFLGVRGDLSVLRRAFDREPASGPGDYKVEHTRGIHANSVGHGKRVPVRMLPALLLAEINERLKATGYPPLDRSWNTAERPIDATGETIWTARLESLMIDATPPAASPPVGLVALVAEDQRASRWIFDTDAGTITRGDGDVDAVLTGTSEDIVLMLSDEANLGVLLRSGRIRHLVAGEDEAASRDVYIRVNTIVQAIRSYVAHGPKPA